jgi:hypothetical protein
MRAQENIRCRKMLQRWTGEHTENMKKHMKTRGNYRSGTRSPEGADIMRTE